MQPHSRAAKVAWWLLPVVGLSLGGCQTLQRLGGLATAPSAASVTAPANKPAAPQEPLVPSPRLIIGRVTSVDQEMRQVMVELAAETPGEALLPETELTTRDAALRETGRLKVSRQLRGRILGTFWAAGSPAVHNEVVWLAP
jgi:hypothetical protein